MAEARKTVPPSADLSPAEQAKIRSSDAADTSPRAPGPDTSGKRVRYIPYKGGTHNEISAADFKREGLDHPSVSANFRNNVFTYEVGTGQKNSLTEEAAKLLTEKYPTMFEYLDDGE